MQAQTFSQPEILHGNNFGQEHGLLQLNVKSMAIDDLGYLWVGTEDGLHRFNAYEFTSFVHQPNDSSSIPDDHIRSILFFKNRLWLATNSSGIIEYSTLTNTFSKPHLSHKQPELNTSYKVIEYSNDIILFSVKNHVIVYNPETNYSKILPLPSTAKESFVSDILYLNSEKSWLATKASGILEFDKVSLEYRQIELLQDESINCFIRHGNLIYIGTENGLYLYSTTSKTLEKTTLKKPINCFFQKTGSEFYIGTDNGLFLFDIVKNRITPLIIHTGKNTQYAVVDINQIIGDTKGNLWIGTEGDGLLYYNTFQKKFNTIKLHLNEYALNNDISTFQLLKENESSLLVGSKLGVLRYNLETQKFTLFQSTKDVLIYTLTKDRTGTIWAGGFTSGLLKYDVSSDGFKKITPKGTVLADNDIIEIIPTDSSTLWICTWAGGIYKFDVKSEQAEELLIQGERLNRARTSFLDSKGNVWLGTDQGAFKISKSGNVTEYNSLESENQKLSGDRIFCINEDNIGNIWLGTNVGLTKLDVKTNLTNLYYQQKGLPNDFIYSIQIDRNNNIWVSSNYGISVLNQQTNNFKNYTISDGLQNNEFNGKAGYEDENGHFYFGGISGINQFIPEEILENPFLPKVYIESVELFNRPIHKNEMFKDSLIFKSHQNVLTFRFAALNFPNSEKCDYQYKMEGFDTDWRPVTKNKSTTYTNLNPGKYTFVVKASNDAGVWNPEYDSMQVIIVPPWYQTKLFRGMFISIFLLSGIVYYFYKTQKLKHQRIKLERIVEHRTIQVNQKNVELKAAFQEAEKQRDNIQFLIRELRHRVKNNLQIISSLLNIQSNSIEDKAASDALQMAKNRIITLDHIENRITDKQENIQIDRFIKGLSESIINVLQGDSQLKYRVAYTLEEIAIANIDNTLIGLILNELITNTTKYAFTTFNERNQLEINCKKHLSSLRLIIRDNGSGYSKEKVRPNALGIDLVTEMVQQLGGSIVINSNNGTENIIDIPI